MIILLNPLISPVQGSLASGDDHNVSDIKVIVSTSPRIIQTSDIHRNQHQRLCVTVSMEEKAKGDTQT